MKNIDLIALLLLILAGLNWGLWSIFDLNIVDYVFSRTWIDRVLYFFMGVAAVYALFTWKIFKVKFGKK